MRPIPPTCSPPKTGTGPTRVSKHASQRNGCMTTNSGRPSAGLIMCSETAIWCAHAGGWKLIEIAAMKITEALFAEHLVFHSLFDHLEGIAPQLKTLAQVKSMAALMESMLKAHSDTEDELFIGPLEHCFEQIGQCEIF